MLKCILGEALIDVLWHEINLTTRYNSKRSNKYECCVIIQIIIIYCVLYRKKSSIGLTVSCLITVAVKMASANQKCIYLGTMGQTDRNRADKADKETFMPF